METILIQSGSVWSQANPELAKSMLQQSIVPSKWIVVLHNTEDESVKFFLNLKEIDDENQTLNNGDILAFLPPVTGG